MRPAVIIPVRIGKHIPDILAKLSRQKCDVVLVIDRNDDFDRSVMAGYENVAIVENKEGDGFLAGKCRDIGLSYAEQSHDQYIFIDEDCIPQEQLVMSHMACLCKDVPVATCGRRLELKYGWKDRREIVTDSGMVNFFSDRVTIVNNPALIRSGQMLWSCNMGLNRKAVYFARKLMKTYMRADRIFDPYFDGHWGGEDMFLGYVLWCAKVLIGVLPYGSNAVFHQEHPSERSNGFKDRLDARVNEMKRRLVAAPQGLDFFEYRP